MNLRAVPESKIEREVCAHATKLGWWCLKLSSPSNRGMPDRMLVKAPGRIVFIEFKRFGKKPTELQGFIIRKLLGLQFQVTVVDNIEDGKAFIDGLA
ncbi:MAG: VRR-NUC domain-containing protein [Alphaproteobacteria bacterium]|nr:VRR-NUC domain-containing protein [Alphaproteobacteria bacterium SS10]